MSDAETEIRAGEYAENFFREENRSYRKRSAGLLLGGIASATALAITMNKVHMDSGDTEQIITNLEGVAAFGGLSLGLIDAFRARKMSQARLKTISRLNNLRFGITES